MSSPATTEWVDGHFIAGDLSLDFANTVFRRWPEPGADLFTNTAALTSWLVRAGLLPETEELHDDLEPALTEARLLRAALWKAFDAHRDCHTIPTDAMARLLETARRGLCGLTIHPQGSTTPRTTQSAFAAIALRAITLVLDPPPQGIRACGRCGWFFIDFSRSRRRRWCSMKTCGNQAKAARHRSAHI